MALSWHLIPAVLAILAAVINLARREWLLNIIGLSLQYLAVFIVTMSIRTPALAVIKLLVGWMSILTLYLTLASTGEITKIRFSAHLSIGEVFRILASLFFLTLVVLFIPEIQSALFPTAPDTLLLAGLGLMFVGILQLGMISEPFYTIIGLLTFLSGFESLYASLEMSTLLEGLFAGVNLGIALVGAYLITKDSEVQKI